MKKIVIKNIVSNLLYQVINIAVNFLVIPLILGNFGSGVNGLIQTVRQILNYIALVGSGISESTILSLYKPLNDRNTKCVSAIVNASGNVFFYAGTIFSIISVLVAFIYPLITKTTLDYLSSVILIIILCSASASEFFVMGKYRALLFADQKIYIINLLQIFSAITSLIITYILIVLNFNILIVQLGVALSYIARVPLIIVYIRFKYSYLDHRVTADLSAMSKRKAATVHQLSGVVSFGSQIVIVSLFCGNEEASVYSVYALVFTGLNMLLSTLSSALIPSFGTIIANGEYTKIYKYFRIYEICFYGMSFLCYTTAYLVILPFISLYTSNVIDDVVYIRPSFALLFVIMGILNCIRTPGGTIINSVGHYKETQSRAIIEMVICLVLQLILVQFIGVEGVLIASIIAYFYRTVDVLFYVNLKIISSSVKKSIMNIIPYIIISLFIVFIFELYIKINIISYFTFTCWVFFIFLVGLVLSVLYNILFNKEEFLE